MSERIPMSDDRQIFDTVTQEATKFSVAAVLTVLFAWAALQRKRLAKWWNRDKEAFREAVSAWRSIADSLAQFTVEFREHKRQNDEIVCTMKDCVRALLNGQKVNAQMSELALENSPVPMWRCSATGKADWVNPACAKYFGLPIKDMLGAGWQSVVHPEHHDRIHRALERTALRHEPYNVEYAVRTPSGWKNTYASGKAILSEDGKTLLNIIGTVEPVHTQKDREEAEAA